MAPHRPAESVGFSFIPPQAKFNTMLKSIANFNSTTYFLLKINVGNVGTNMYRRMRNPPTAGVNTHPDDPAMLSSRDEGLLFFYYYLSTR
jgi:hypothetical protein